MTRRDVGVRPTKTSQCIWLDAGLHGGTEVISDERLLRDAMAAKGWILAEDLTYFAARWGKHNERNGAGASRRCSGSREWHQRVVGAIGTSSCDPADCDSPKRKPLRIRLEPRRGHGSEADIH